MTRPLPFAELYRACVRAGACADGLAWLREQSHYADFVHCPDYAFWAACYVPGADVAALQAAVLASGDVGWCYCFARHVPGADVAALGAAVLAWGDAWWCHHFARNVPGADVAALRRVS
jgi:hypothetical protein